MRLKSKLLDGMGWGGVGGGDIYWVGAVLTKAREAITRDIAALSIVLVLFYFSE